MKKNELKSILKEINKYNNIIKESYLYNEDEDLMPSDDFEGDDENFYGDEEMIDGDDELGHSKSAEDIIDDIREKALNGVAQYAKEVDSDEYNIFKNIWMTCDKFYMSKNKENDDLK